MTDRPTQRMLPFDIVTAETVTPAPTISARYEPSDETLEGFECLEGWLRDARQAG